jgi:hypothetical protein
MLTIAIPTMRRWSFLKTMLPVFLARAEVSEVILCDETGEDAAAAHEAFGTNPKLKIHVNEKRLGIYENKKKVLGLAKGWVALLDSDNVFPDEWFEYLADLDFSDKTKIYGSADFKSLEETGKVTTPCQEFSGMTLDKTTWNTFLHKPKCFLLLNDGNWILHRDLYEYLPSMPSDALKAADAVFMLHIFINRGCTIEYPAGFQYIHMVHSGSSWLQTEVESTAILRRIDWRV